MSKTTPEAFEAMKARLIANGGSVMEPLTGRSMSDCIKVISASKDMQPATKKKKPRKNQTETAFEAILATRGYDKVQFEGMTLELATGSKYTADFLCMSHNKTHVCLHLYEVKGQFIREASKVRLKVAARQFPMFRFILAQRQSKKDGWGWTETVVES